MKMNPRLKEFSDNIERIKRQGGISPKIVELADNFEEEYKVLYKDYLKRKIGR